MRQSGPTFRLQYALNSFAKAVVVFTLKGTFDPSCGQDTHSISLLLRCCETDAGP